jgi:phosphoglycerate dehydrogenase-like enzyme
MLSTVEWSPAGGGYRATAPRCPILVAMSILVLNTSVFLDAYVAALRRLAPAETIVTDPDAPAPGEVEVIVAFRLRPGIASRFPRLRFVASPGAGADDVLAARDLPAGVPVTRVHDPRQGARMAQHVAHAVLRWHRGAARYEAQQRQAQWQRHLPEPEERWAAGLMGYGAQGRAVASVLRAMGYPVRAWTRSARTEPGVATFSGREGLAPFLAGTRVLVCALPLTRETSGIVDAGVLSGLPSGGYLVNVSRGGVVVERDVLAAVERGSLAGAALDVFEQEPLPADSPLWRDGRIAVTPHVAAMPDVETAVRQMLDDLARSRRGEPLLHVVDRERGY